LVRLTVWWENNVHQQCMYILIVIANVQVKYDNRSVILNSVGAKSKGRVFNSMRVKVKLLSGIERGSPEWLADALPLRHSADRRLEPRNCLQKLSQGQFKGGVGVLLTDRWQRNAYKSCLRGKSKSQCYDLLSEIYRKKWSRYAAVKRKSNIVTHVSDQKII